MEQIYFFLLCSWMRYRACMYSPAWTTTDSDAYATVVFESGLAAYTLALGCPEAITLFSAISGSFRRILLESTTHENAQSVGEDRADMKYRPLL